LIESFQSQLGNDPQFGLDPGLRGHSADDSQQSGDDPQLGHDPHMPKLVGILKVVHFCRRFSLLPILCSTSVISRIFFTNCLKNVVLFP
jgi:hypothetical protein